jgi:hypothetical protein
LGDPTLSQADVQMTKAIIDIPRPLGISVPDYIIVRKNGMPARKAEADLGWRHRSIEARRLSSSCSRLLSRPAGDLRRTQRFTPIPLADLDSRSLKKCPGTTEGG